MSEHSSARAVMATGYGGPQVLEVRAVDVDPPGPGQVLVEVRAAAVNPFDLKVVSGTFGTDPARLPLRLGSEVAGVVVAAGEGSRHPVGEQVIGYPVSGGYASHVVAGDDDVLPKPPGLAFPEAAGLLLVGVTAAHLLHATDVAAGDVVLLHGASGGVGRLVVQLALARGATVIGTAGPGRQDAVAALGATPVVYGDGLADRVRALAPDGVSVALDTAGTDEAVDVSLALVADRARIATIAAFERGAAAGVKVLGAGADPGREVRRAARAELVAMAGRGELTVTVDRTFALDDVAAAHAHQASGRAAGKVVLLP